MRGALVLGVVQGLTIALLAVGLVLIYKAARFVNFAHAQLGVLSAMLLGRAVLGWGVSWWIAFPLAVAAGAALGALTERLVFRPLAARSRMTLLIASIGLSQLLLALTYYTWLGPPRSELVLDGYPVPFDVRLQVDPTLALLGKDLLVIVVVPLAALGLVATMRYTMLGKAIRASACNRDAAGLAGIPVGRLSTVTWGIAGGLSALSAILAAPNQTTFDTQALGPALLLYTLGAAAVGGFTSLPLAFAGGVALGVIDGVAVYFTSNVGVAQLVVFLVILGGLVVRSRTLARSARGHENLDVGSPTLVVPAVIASRAIVRHSRSLLIGLGLFLGLLAPHLPMWRSEPAQYLLALTLVYAMVAVSVTIVAGWSGQVSLGQFAFVGVGAYVGADLMGAGWSVVAAALVAGAVGASIAVVVGLPALRLRGLTLAVTTLGLAVVTPTWLLRQEWMAPRGALTLAPAGVRGLGPFATQRSVYYLALAFLVVVCSATAALRRSTAGRLVLAVRDNERASAALGVSASTVKLTVFALAGFLAGAAGVVYGAVNRNLTADQFGAHLSLTVLAIVVVGGIGSLPGAIVGAVLLFGLPALTADWFRGIFANQVQFGLFLGGTALIVTVLANPGGVVDAFRRGWQVFLFRLAETVERQQPANEDGDPLALEVVDVHVHFGGVTALDGASLHVRPGEIVGLIGTNGAGKTTLLDVVSGLIAPTTGSVRVDGREIGRLAPELRAHFGVARSFQDAVLFPGLTVTETVQLALARRERTGFVAALLGAPWVRFTERRTQHRARALVDEFGLGPWADRLTSELSTGTRRICDLVVQAASEPRLLLLDEPTAGVAQREAEAFGPLLRSLVTRLGCAALVIDHDMPLMLGLADRIYCMEAGRVIAEGTPAEVREDPRVIAGYLGTDDVAIARSGSAGGRTERRSRTAERQSAGRPRRRVKTDVGGDG